VERADSTTRLVILTTFERHEYVFEALAVMNVTALTEPEVPAMGADSKGS
jgi:hypothetical protein